MGLRLFQDGSRKDFPKGTTRVVFGRDPQVCQVTFPPGDNRVGRRHCEVIAEVGHWKFKLDEDLPVFINGRRAAQDREFDERSGPLEVRFGTKDGPLVVLEAFVEQSAAAGTMVQTRRYKKDKGAQGRIRQLSAFLGAVAALLLLAAGAVIYLIEQKDYDLRLLLKEQSATAIDEALINQKIRPSVYLVIKQSAAGAEVASATAWVVARDRGLLATNAHVASEFFDLAPGEKLLVRQPQPPYNTHQVTGVEIHPGYDAFDRAVQSYQPVIQSLYGDVEDLKLVPAYDVGLLVVEGRADLAPDLPLAGGAVLESLEPGARLAYVGYPSEGSVITVQTAKPSPTTQPDGAAVAITDYFNVRREDGLNQLVQHNLPATGGASGSPIVNASGEVVAVLSGGNVIITPKGRAPSAVGINFAQRADVLAELLDGTAAQHLESYRAIWADGLALFDSYEEALPSVLLGDLKKWAKRQDEPQTLLATQAALGEFDADQGAALWSGEIEAPAGSLGVYAIAASRSDGSAPNIDLMVVKDGERLALNKQPDGQPLVGFRLDQATRLTVVVYGADAGVEFRIWAGGWPATGN